MSLQAVFLDMDGVIVDSELQFKRLEGPLFRRLMPDWRDEYHKRIVGMGVGDLHGYLAREHGLKTGRHEFLQLCRELAGQVYNSHVSLAEGLTEFLDELALHKIPAGVASSSPKEGIRMVLRRFGLEGRFAVVSSADDTGVSKPDPAIYILAAKLAGADPKNCVAVEDSETGLRSALAAGMHCLAYRNGFNDEQDLSLAHGEIRGFKELGVARLSRLVSR